MNEHLHHFFCDFITLTVKIVKLRNEPSVFFVNTLDIHAFLNPVNRISFNGRVQSWDLGEKMIY